ncbi:MAG: hypothetical protein IJP26_02045 [Clostridia bacterium]|nr:hypothetical protein [Clostridia bacterium]
MAFTTQIFCFIFLPIMIISYFCFYFLQKRCNFLQKIRSTDILLIMFSIVFYAWACFNDVLVFLAYIFILYMLGVLIGKVRKQGLNIKIYDNKNRSRFFSVALIITLFSCALVAIALIHFKCMPIVAPIFEFLSKTPIKTDSIIAPLGISFIAFSAISYLVDVYKGEADEGNFIDFLLYMTLFSKVVSGPIVLWRDYKNQTATISANRFIDGITRVMIGFSK